MSTDRLTPRQQQILDVIDQHLNERGYPPSVREIGKAVGLTSPSSVQNHLNTLNELGYLRRDPTKPRAMEVRYDPNSGASGERRPFRHVPLVGDVAAGTDVLAEQNVEEIMPVPTDLCGDGELFMLRVRGDSMIDAGIFDGDYIVAKGRPIEEGVIEQAAASIAEELRLLGPELTSEQVGFAVLEHLREIDHVAYMRFASVYKGFDDAADFQREITLLTKATEPKRHDSRA